MAKHIIVYHDKCNDGFGAAFIAHQALTASLAEGDEIVLVPANYGQVDVYDLKIYRHDKVHILDFSFPVQDLLNICELAEEVTWLDHHKTAIDAWFESGIECPKNLEHWLDKSYSGAMLAWVHYRAQDFPSLAQAVDSAPRWVKLIDDRDRWIFQYPETKAFHAGASLYDRTIEAWKVLTEQPTTTALEGQTILDYQDKLYQQLMETAHEITIDGHKGLAINAPGQFASDLGNLLARKSGTFGAVYAADGKGYKFSLRSIGEYDVSAIAKAFGGGGHKNAAGFSIEHPTGISGEASGLTLWSAVDDLTSYCHDAGGSNND